MFCGKCGAKNADDAQFCTGCGAKLNGGQVTKSTASVVVDANNKNRKVGMIAVAVVAVLVVALFIGLFGGRSYKKTVDKFITATFEADAESIFELLPEKMIDYALEEEGYDDDELDELIDEANEDLEYQIKQIERYYGEDWKISYEIINVEDVKDRSLNSLKDDYEDVGVKVSAAKTIEIEFTITADETEISNSMEIAVIKVGRSWYLDMASMGSLF